MKRRVAVVALVVVALQLLANLPGVGAASGTVPSRTSGWTDDHYLTAGTVDVSGLDTIAAEFTIELRPGARVRGRWECDTFAWTAVLMSWSPDQTANLTLAVNRNNVPATYMSPVPAGVSQCIYHLFSEADATAQFRITAALVVISWSPGGPDPSAGVPTDTLPPADPTVTPPGPEWTYCPAVVPSGFVGPPGPSLCPLATPTPEPSAEPEHLCEGTMRYVSTYGQAKYWDGASSSGAVRCNASYTYQSGDIFHVYGSIATYASTSRPALNSYLTYDNGAGAQVRWAPTGLSCYQQDLSTSSTDVGTAPLGAFDCYSTWPVPEFNQIWVRTSGEAWECGGGGGWGPGSSRDCYTVNYTVDIVDGPSAPTPGPTGTPGPTVGPAPTPSPTPPPVGAGQPGWPSMLPVDICQNDPTIAACQPVTPVPTLQSAPPGQGGGPGGSPEPHGVEDCEDSVLVKPGTLPYESIPPNEFPGLTVDVGKYVAWVGGAVNNLGRTASNVAIWGNNTAIDYVVPGECVGVMATDLVEEAQTRVPFAWFAEAQAALGDGVTGTVAFPVFEIAGTSVDVNAVMTPAAAALSPWRGVLAAFIWLGVVIVIARKLMGTVGAGEGGG